MPQGLNTANCCKPADDLGERKDESLCIAKHLEHPLHQYGQYESPKWEIIPMPKLS